VRAGATETTRDAERLQDFRFTRGREWFELPAGLLEGELGVRPERHIFVHVKSSWFEITDGLPQLNLEQLNELRR
jgi:hypothetical protein